MQVNSINSYTLVDNISFELIFQSPVYNKDKFPEAHSVMLNRVTLNLVLVTVL